MKTSKLKSTLASVLILAAGTAAAQELTAEKAEMMGRVEDFFMHNFRDVSTKKSLDWGDVVKAEHGNRSIRFSYEARIWDRETIVANQVFTFDPTGKFVRVENLPGFPKKKQAQPVDTTTQKGLISLVEAFFGNNFRDITTRKTVEWGPVESTANGHCSIRYKYEAKIWDKDSKLMNQIFTFDAQGHFISVKDVEGFPKPL